MSWPIGTNSPSQIIRPDIDIVSLGYSCIIAFGGWVVTLMIYSLIWCSNANWIRKVYTPRIFTARVPPRLPTRWYKWIYMLISLNIELRILEEVGLDAFMLNRMLLLVIKCFSFIVPITMVALVPLYAQSADDSVPGFKRFSLQAFVDNGGLIENQLMLISVIWWNTLVILYFVVKEYRNYVKHRHNFLRRQSPQCYTVLVERIPNKLCNEPTLMHYFRKIFGNRVVSAYVVDNNTMLNYAVKQRLKVVEILEDAILEYEVTGRRPWRFYVPWWCKQIKQKLVPLGTGLRDELFLTEDETEEGIVDTPHSSLVEEEQRFLEDWHRRTMEEVRVPEIERKHPFVEAVLHMLASCNICMYIDKIKSYEYELKVWNRRVKRLQQNADIKRKKIEEDAIVQVIAPSQKVIREQLRVRMRRDNAVKQINHRKSFRLEENDGATVTSQKSHISAITTKTDDFSLYTPWDDGRHAWQREYFATVTSSQLGDNDRHSSFRDDTESILDFEDDEVYYHTDHDEKVIFERAGLDDILRYAVDQNARSSAFITFSSLTATMSAAQSIIDQPLKMSISLAPDIRDVLWNNLGMPLINMAVATWIVRIAMITLIMIFGTFSAFIAGLTNMSSLRDSWSWLDDWLKKPHHEMWVFVFEQIGPLCMVIVLSVLPPIIDFVLIIQRRRSKAECQLEFFQIYYYFLILQVFLFYGFTGGILSMFHIVTDGNPVEILALLGKALPSQEIFFLQYAVTRCALLSLELLRVSDLVLALLRGILKRSRTARSRRRACCGMRTIDNPTGGYIERVGATITLMFTIGICYSVICPAITVAVLIFAIVALIVYRNQFLHVYTHETESGGLLFPYYVRGMVVGVVIFHLTMMGLFISANDATAATCCLPIMILCLSFLVFAENAYERASRYLPLGDASELDIISSRNPHIIYKHPSTLAPATLEPEPVEETPYDHYRRASFYAYESAV